MKPIRALCSFQASQRPFCPPLLVGKTSKSRLEQLLIKEGAGKNCLRQDERDQISSSRLGDPTTGDPAHTLILSETPPLIYCYKNPHQFFGVEIHSFLRQRPGVSPFAWQWNKTIPFYFTHNPVSKISFGPGICTERPSFQKHTNLHKIELYVLNHITIF